MDHLKRDGLGRWSDWDWSFTTEGRWISIVEQSEQATASQDD